MAREATRSALLGALERIVRGQPKRSNGELTAAALAEEAGVGRASLYRCRDILKALEAAKLGRSAMARLPAPPIPIKSSERELRDAVTKLANRILLLETILIERDREIGRLRAQVREDAGNVVPLTLPRGTQGNP